MTGCLGSDQFGQQADAVNIGRRFRSGDLSDGRKHVGKVAEQVANTSRCNLARPASDEWNAEATLVEVSLLAAVLNACFRMLVCAMDPPGILGWN